MAKSSIMFVRTVSLDMYEDDGELFGDNGFEMENSYGQNQKEWLLSKLTKRQRAVAELLFDGWERKDVAQKLGVCLQAIHQIVPRIRKRLKAKAGLIFP
jgi:DNA-binding NarL/FixJ family response regulator